MCTCIYHRYAPGFHVFVALLTRFMAFITSYICCYMYYETAEPEIKAILIFSLQFLQVKIAFSITQ